MTQSSSSDTEPAEESASTVGDEERANAEKESTGSETTGSGNPETNDAVSEENLEDAKQQSKEIDERYDPDARRSVTIPGTGGTISGTAFDGHVPEGEGETNKPDEEPIPTGDYKEEDHGEEDQDSDKDEPKSAVERGSERSEK
ncbi:hypothetical protein FOS14_09915 [Skermania sp. ID1734]|uniref:hypothetical protein n=1 Tax=Skermania sp. ID1734 TaxID=2597516 RepID=UPI00117F9C3D|nr:hypothetical protein [Skermania sp. ID1734]TSE00117.1 hypothetical protein FOS14_09915 [Skermania sp. ID1734]